MSAPKVGDAFPADVKFTYVPVSKETADIKACGMPIALNAGQDWQNKKVVLFSVPGAFTPTCSVSHLPGYIAKRAELRAKGVDVVAVVASNDPWVMSAWGKANGITDDSILFLSDADLGFSSRFGWSGAGRTGRYAMIIDNGKIVYAAKEPAGDVTVSGVDAVLSKL